MGTDAFPDDEGVDTKNEGGENSRKERKHKGTRKHRHLLVVDLNGLLVDRRMSAYVAANGTKRASDAKFGKFHIYNRPHMTEFVEWAFQHFTVGVWSSAQAHNAKTLVNHIWGKEHRDKLAFVWGQDKCTHVGATDPCKPHSKPILLKELSKLWELKSYARFGPANTLLLDDSPYKAVMNPDCTAIHPAEYKPGEDSASEVLLGQGGQLREYLEKLSEAESVSDFVRDYPWANHGPAAPPSTDEVLRKATTGGKAVAAAVAAANRVGDAAAGPSSGKRSKDEAEAAAAEPPKKKPKTMHEVPPTF